MLRKFFVCVLFLCVIPFTFADLGHSTVYAVCRITMRDGSVKEGVLRIAAGGYEKQLHSNGFYFEFNGQLYAVDLFSPSFRSIDFRSGEVIYDPAPEDGGTSFPDAKGTLYYLRTLPMEHYFQDARQDALKKSPSGSSAIVLDRTITQRHRYLLTDYIPVFFTIPTQNLDMEADMLPLLPAEKRPKPDAVSPRVTNIPLAQIAKLELLPSPASRWTTEIRRRLDQQNAEYEKQGLEEWLLPVWFHQIQPGKEEYEYYKGFESWKP